MIALERHRKPVKTTTPRASCKDIMSTFWLRETIDLAVKNESPLLWFLQLLYIGYLIFNLAQLRWPSRCTLNISMFQTCQRRPLLFMRAFLPLLFGQNPTPENHAKLHFTNSHLVSGQHIYTISKYRSLVRMSSYIGIFFINASGFDVILATPERVWVSQHRPDNEGLNLKISLFW
jgi:hypothetical protein